LDSKIPRIFRQIDSFEEEMVKTLVRLISVPAIGPESSGLGESEKAEVLTQMLASVGFDRVERFDADDPSVPSKKRPNIVAYVNGKTDAQRVWVVTHLDVVPPGEESLWKITRPFQPKIQDGCVFGRGSEDNGQSIVAALYAAKALKTGGIETDRTFALAFVSDEEHGSTKGILHLLSQGVFRKDDWVIVPDNGTPAGDFIEIAEKSILWLKIVTEGKQAHGSLPNKGLNAHRIGMQVALALDALLHQKYGVANDYFSPPNSTFEPTRKDLNVDAVNIIPGEDVVYFDCRILPEYDVEEVLASIEGITARIESDTGARIRVEVLQKQVSPPLADGKSEIVALLRKALKVSRGMDATVGGVGGGTCAAFFRQAGIPAVVWCTIDEVPHSPDEYARIANIIADAKVFALLPVL
jgi:succinyl-diaminopimelate desuccinylase